MEHISAGLSRLFLERPREGLPSEEPGASPEQAREGAQSWPKQLPCGVRVGHWRDAGWGGGRGCLCLGTPPPVGHSDGGSLGEVRRGTGRTSVRLSGTAPRGRVGSTSRAGVALIQGKDVRGCDGGGGEGRPHGKSLKLCACDAWGRHGWHRAPRCGADGGFSESRNAAPGGPRATAARGESPGSALRLAALPGSGQGPRPILLKYIRTR